MSSLLMTAALALASSPPPSTAIAERLGGQTTDAVNIRIDPKNDTVYWESLAADSRAVEFIKLRKKRKVQRLLSIDYIATDPVPTAKRNPLYNLFDEENQRWALHRKSKEVVSPSAASDLHPTISGSQGQLAFTSGRSGRGDIYLAKAKGTNQSPKLVAQSPDVEMLPTWSPDGSALAYLRISPRGQALVVVRNLDTTPTTSVIADERLSPVSFSWRPDGKELAFYRRDFSAGNALYTVPATGGTAARRLANVQVQARGPAWIQGTSWAVVTIRANDAIVAVTPLGDIQTLNTGTYGHGEVRSGELLGSQALVFTAFGHNTEASKAPSSSKVYLWSIPNAVLKPQSPAGALPTYK